MHWAYMLLQCLCPLVLGLWVHSTEACATCVALCRVVLQVFPGSFCVAFHGTALALQHRLQQTAW